MKENMNEMDSFHVVKKMPHIHCARGPKGCEKCKDYEKKGDTWALVKILLTPGEWARPITQVILKGQKIHAEYDIEMRFNDIIDAKKYAQDHEIEIQMF